jgi:hypothetical protein
LTGARPIKLTSPRCPSAWQPNHGRRSTYQRGKTVQTTETTSRRMADAASTPAERADLKQVEKGWLRLAENDEARPSRPSQGKPYGEVARKSD